MFGFPIARLISSVELLKLGFLLRNSVPLGSCLIERINSDELTWSLQVISFSHALTTRLCLLCALVPCLARVNVSQISKN